MAWQKTTFLEILKKIAKRYPKKDALIFKERRITYFELLNESLSFAKLLLSIGVRKGDRCAIFLPSSIEWVICEFGVGIIGALLVVIDTSYRLKEIEYILNNSEASVLITKKDSNDKRYLEVFLKLCPKIQSFRQEIDCKSLPFLKKVILISKGKNRYRIFPKLQNGKKEERVETNLPDDPFLVVYTSGTTGFPKGVVLSQNSILQNGFLIGEGERLTYKDVIYNPVPLSHIFGNVNALLAGITHGSSIVLEDSFDPKTTLKRIAKLRCTAIYGFPHMFRKILDCKTFSRYDLSSLRTGNMSGDICPENLVKEVIEKMGVKDLLIPYGMTETSPAITQTDPDDPIDYRIGSVGRPLLGVEVKIVDPKTKKELPPGVPGELLTRGFHVMKGYLKLDEETKKVIDEDGWFHTGDILVMDGNGYFKYMGRLKDMFIHGGFNVYPKEIEDFLLTNQKISEVHVIGVPDFDAGEVPMAYIKLKDGVFCTKDEIIAFCRDKIADFKIPRYIKFVEEFPRTSTGKVQKYKLREMAIKEIGLQIAGTFDNIVELLRERDRKIQEQHKELLLSKHKYEHLFEEANDAIITLDRKGRIQLINRKGAYLLGAKKETLFGKELKNFISREKRQIFSEKLKSWFSKRETNFETEIISTSKRVIPVEISTSPIEIGESYGGVQLILRDLTERKKYEEELIKTRKLAYIGELAAGLAHELRNPLVSMGAVIELLSQKIKGEENKLYLNTLLNEAKRLDRIIKQFLEFARPKKPVFSPCKINEILDSVLILLKGRLDKNRIKIIKDYGKTSKILADSDQITQLFLNVIINSIEAMAGGGKLFLSTKNSIKKRYLKIEIKDTGCGIKRGDIKQICKPFFSTKKGGSGLGLSIAARIVEGHKGKFEIDSKPKKGTTVTIYLPLKIDEGIKDGF